MDENIYTTPDGVQLVAVETALPRTFMRPASSCNLCHFKARAETFPNHCFPETLPEDEPRCCRDDRKDGRDIYWIRAELAIDPNPLEPHLPESGKATMDQNTLTVPSGAVLHAVKNTIGEGCEHCWISRQHWKSEDWRSCCADSDDFNPSYPSCLAGKRLDQTHIHWELTEPVDPNPL